MAKGLLEEREVRLSAGAVRYREAGEPVVFVHGLLVHGGVRRGVAPRLARNFRCVVPTWPLGADAVAMDGGVALPFGGMTRIVAGILEALRLEGVTLSGNDTGGALCQPVVSAYPERAGLLVRHG